MRDHRPVFRRGVFGITVNRQGLGEPHNLDIAASGGQVGAGQPNPFGVPEKTIEDGSYARLVVEALQTGQPRLELRIQY